MENSDTRFKLFKAICEVAKENGHNPLYRHVILKQYSRTVKQFDPTHTDTTRGDHVGEWMTKIAKSWNGKVNKDLTKNGNAKKNTVRIDY